MFSNTCKGYKGLHLVLITSILLVAPSLRAEDSAALESFSDGTKEYLADPARTGSLVGSLLAGAALANPLAPLLGSVAGFFIGKTSDYTNTKYGNSKQSAYLNRSIIPTRNAEVANLHGLTAKTPLKQNGQATRLPLPEIQSPMDSQIDIQPSTSARLTGETRLDAKNKLLFQLTSACNNLDSSKPLPVHCYYYSQ